MKEIDFAIRFTLLTPSDFSAFLLVKTAKSNDRAIHVSPVEFGESGNRDGRGKANRL